MRLRTRLGIVLGAAVFLLAAAHHLVLLTAPRDPLRPGPSVAHAPLLVALDIFSVLLLGTALFLSISRIVNRRIERVGRELARVGGLEDLASRVTVDRFGDEISRLARDINGTLDRLETEAAARAKAETLLRSNDRLVSIGRLCSCLAHEIQNPLLAVSASLQVLKAKAGPDDAEAREAAALAEAEIARVRQIVDDLLGSHRMEGEALSAVALGDAVKDALKVLDWSGKSGSVRVELAADDRLEVHGSPGQLRQVFLNLLLNAFDAVDPKTGVVRIETRRPEGSAMVEIHVLDDGPGVPGAVKDTLFDPFTTAKDGSGAGLGLYISRLIVRNHGGELVYDPSHHPGSHFIVRLPLWKEGL